jgi:hypothetical protein
VRGEGNPLSALENPELARDCSGRSCHLVRLTTRIRGLFILYSKQRVYASHFGFGALCGANLPHPVASAWSILASWQNLARAQSRCAYSAHHNAFPYRRAGSPPLASAKGRGRSRLGGSTARSC